MRTVVSMGRLLVLIGLVAVPVWGQEAKDDARGRLVSTPEQVVQEQLEAYNRHDLEGFLRTYAPEVKVFDFPDTLRFSGQAAMRERYGKLFESNPELRAEIDSRIVQGDHVIDHERVSLGGGRRLTAVAIYRVEGGKIIAVWFLR